ncbi:MAG: hypothetical protein M1814_005356 [Vezdaea aestivalis]|nr:MAG: hypothetical protein M1814_005356 [Vezdaea aestivalis]
MTPKPIYVAVIGTGGVGAAFLSQLESLSKTRPLSTILISRSKQMILSPDFRPLDLENWQTELELFPTATLPFSEILNILSSAPGPVVLVDNTSNQDVADAYPSTLRRGIAVVTPNKKAFSSGLGLWEDIFSAAAAKDAPPVYHESSVCAGLPVISTLKDLVATGDRVDKIEGVFSGTMSYLFNSFCPVNGEGQKFSAVVRKARALGYTEPDPRDDLNGLDVARKLTILARLAGLMVEGPESFPVQSLIPAGLEDKNSAEDFLDGLADSDETMDRLKEAAEKEGKVLRYVGSIDMASKRVEVKIDKFDKSHPIAALQGSDNVVSFYTKRYGKNPMIIQGAGAGADVTAMGVTGDLIKVIERLQ